MKLIYLFEILQSGLKSVWIFEICVNTQEVDWNQFCSGQLILYLEQYFYRYVYDRCSVVTSSLKCTLQAIAQFRRVFFPAVSQHGPYLRSARYARLTAQFSSLHCYLRLRFRGYKIVSHSRQGWFDCLLRTRSKQFSLCLCIWCMKYIYKPSNVREIPVHHKVYTHHFPIHIWNFV